MPAQCRQGRYSALCCVRYRTDRTRLCDYAGLEVSTRRARRGSGPSVRMTAPGGLVRNVTDPATRSCRHGAPIAARSSRNGRLPGSMAAGLRRATGGGTCSRLPGKGPPPLTMLIDLEEAVVTQYVRMAEMFGCGAGRYSGACGSRRVVMQELRPDSHRYRRQSCRY